MHMCYERPGLITTLNRGGYDKWDRDRGGGGGSGGAGSGAGGAWAGRDRERDRERERQMRAHQMSLAHAPEPDASSLFPAPVRVTGRQDSVSRQIQTKLGDYHLAQSFIDDPSKSIGICAEPPSPAPCPPSRRESEFKKPAHAIQNGVRIHHQRSHISHNKSDGPGSTGAPIHRPPPLRIPNGVQSSQHAIDSSQPPIESILKEMKSLPTPLSVIAATPRKELENKFIFNPYTNKVQENPQLVSNDLKPPLPKPGLDRISNSRSSVSPSCDVNKDLGLSESDDEVANTHAIGPPISPLGSGSPSSGSSSPSEDSESESSSAESTTPAPAPAVQAPAPAPAPTQRSSWSLSNFAPPAAHPPETYDSGKELRHALADIKGKPSPISEMSDSETSSPSPGVGRRRRSIPNRVSTASSDEETSRHSSTATSQPSAPLKRGRPPKARPSEERPPKKRRGRPPKTRPPTPPATTQHLPPPDPPADSDVEPDPPQHQPLQDNKTHIFRRVFTPKAKSDEGGGKGGKGGKGKGGKGKGQVTIIERTPESGADEESRRHRSRSVERRNEEALARVSPPQEVERRIERPDRRRDIERHDRPSAERISNDRVPSDRIPERPPNDRFPNRLSERSSHERIPSDRIPMERTSNDRIPIERTSNDRIPDRLTVDRIPLDQRSTDRSTSDRSSTVNDRRSVDRLSGGLSDRLVDRPPTERLLSDKMDRLAVPHERLSGERMSNERIASEKIPHERHTDTKAVRLLDNKMLIDRLAESKASIDRLVESKPEKVTGEKPERTFVRAEADVGIKTGRGSERLEEASSNVSERRRARLMVRLPLSRLRPELLRALQRPRRALPKRPPTPHTEQSGEVAATNHERTDAYTGQTPIYFSYFERLPADALSDEERDHKYYLEEATRLRSAAERSQEPLPRVMLYLESVLCFVLTGRVLELELDTKGAFTIYRETIEYIKSIHSMPQRFRASPHDTFNKLDILSLRVQALLYLRMFKMYNREVKEYNKIVNEYQQKPALAESVSPLSPTPSPAGSVGSVGSGSASSGYCSLAHSVPAHAHQALLLLNKYYAFLYVAHDLWEQADTLCRLRANRDLFIAVDRKCGPLSLSSTFRHLVQYVRHAISLLKSVPRE